MCSRLVRLLLWNAMVHEGVYAFSWPEMQRMFKRMQSLVQNNENTDQREVENMGEKEGEMVKQAGVNQQNSGPEVYYPIRGRGNAAASPDDVRGMQNVQQQNVQQQIQFDITADKRESFTEKKLVATLEKAERLPGRKRSDNGGNKKNDGDGNCCGGAGAQQTDRRTPGLRATRNNCCDTKAKQQSRNVNQKLSEAEQASRRAKWGDLWKIWLLLVVSLIPTGLGVYLYDTVGKQHCCPSIDEEKKSGSYPLGCECFWVGFCGCFFGVMDLLLFGGLNRELYQISNPDTLIIKVSSPSNGYFRRTRFFVVVGFLVNAVVIGVAGVSVFVRGESRGFVQDKWPCRFAAYHCVSSALYSFFFYLTFDWIPHPWQLSWPQRIEP